MNDAALLVMDMQRGNFSGSSPIFQGAALLDAAKKLISKARSAGVLIVFIQNRGGAGDPDEYGTLGWDVHPSISPLKTEQMIEKTTPDAFHGTGLQMVLDSHGIKTLVVMGLQTEFCIDTTCRRAFSLGYDVLLIQDAHSTWDSPVLSARQIIDHHNYVLGGFFVQLKFENEIKFT